MGRLSNKITLITGAASVPGLGSATAMRFAEEGAVVYCSDSDVEGAEKVATMIRDKGGLAEAIGHDVTSETDWDKVMAAVEAGHGQLDVLVNNAGIALLHPIEQLSLDDWSKQISVSLTSVFHGTKRAVIAMRKAGKGGSIINMSSVLGMIGEPDSSAYGAAKGGIRLFSKSVAVECAKENIRVNTVHPGLIKTNMQKVGASDKSGAYEAAIAMIPLKRMGEPEDVANLNLFLASDEANYITGAEFTIDGGMTAQ